MNMQPKRKGAIRRSDVPADILEQLNSGEIESLTLAEALVIDYAALLERAAPEIGKNAILQMQKASTLGVKQRMALAARLLLDRFGKRAFEKFAAHRSDTVRGWAAFMLEKTSGLTLQEKLTHIRPLADDPNPGVREWAWIALRPSVAAEIKPAIDILAPWTDEESMRLRRYASEITRPRGVWCAHITLLKEEPELCLPILEPLYNDPEKYVQDSVANWLNDASKSKSEWVQKLCEKWEAKSQSASTKRIIKRALRSLKISEKV